MAKPEQKPDELGVLIAETLSNDQPRRGRNQGASLRNRKRQHGR